ncbi:ubiquitin-conjugating enzyme E2 U [Erethizon dorsatum]
MHSRAYALLQRDLRKLMEKDYEGITAFPLSEDMMEWKANIEGLQNSIWQGLVFSVTINFTPDYNFVPPTVKFVTIPFHPNVDPDTGEPCIDFLNNSDKWNSRYTLSSILLALQVMLSNPVTENPVNLEAAQMLNEDRFVYRKVLQRLFQKPLQCKKRPLVIRQLSWVHAGCYAGEHYPFPPDQPRWVAFTAVPSPESASQATLQKHCAGHHPDPVNDGKPRGALAVLAMCFDACRGTPFRYTSSSGPHSLCPSGESKGAVPEETRGVEIWKVAMSSKLCRADPEGCRLLMPRRASPSKVISFDDYHKTWCGIATSKATEYHRRPCKVT